MKARVFVKLKSAILDPQGKTVLRAAQQMGYDEIKSVRIGKLIELEISSENRIDAEVKVADLSRKLLSNPQMETYDIQWIDNGSDEQQG